MFRVLIQRLPNIKTRNSRFVLITSKLRLQIQTSRCASSKIPTPPESTKDFKAGASPLSADDSVAKKSIPYTHFGNQNPSETITSYSTVDSNKNNHYTSTASTSSQLIEDTTLRQTPPFIVRVSIVSLSVGLATPLFATIGAAGVWYSYLPNTSWGRYLKYIIGLLIGGGGLSLIYNYFIPFLQNNSEIVLPFAISNAITSGVLYSLAELTFGFDALKRVTINDMAEVSAWNSKSFFSKLVEASRNNFKPSSTLPIIGGTIGALAVFISPLLWPVAFKVCFPDKDIRHLFHLDDTAWLLDVYCVFAIPVALPVGIISGMTLHTVLYPVIAGVSTVSWHYTSLPALLLISAASIAYFVGCKNSNDVYYYEERLVPTTGETISMNIKTQQILNDDGQTARLGALKLNVFDSISFLRGFIPSFMTSKKASNCLSKGLSSEQSFSGKYLNLKSSKANQRITTDDMRLRRSYYLLADYLLRYLYLKRKLQTPANGSNQIAINFNSSIYDKKMIEAQLLDLVANFAADFQLGTTDFKFEDFISCVEISLNVACKSNETTSKPAETSNSIFQSLSFITISKSPKDLQTWFNESVKSSKTISSYFGSTTKNSSIPSPLTKLLLSTAMLLANFDAFYLDYYELTSIDS